MPPHYTSQQKNQVYRDLIEAIKTQFGDQWASSFNRNLRPSPIEEIAQKNNISKRFVQQTRHAMLIMGQVFNEEAIKAITDVIFNFNPNEPNQGLQMVEQQETTSQEDEE